MNNLLIYFGSGHYCSCRVWQDMYFVSNFKLECPNCGRTRVIKPNIFELVKLIREGRKLSKAELSRRTGLSVSTIKRIEDKRSCGSRKTIEKLIDALGANRELLLKKWNDARLVNDKRLSDYYNSDFIDEKTENEGGRWLKLKR